jgi:transcriptional regulator with XRE-family HTH domain
MARKFSELREKMPPPAQRRAHERAAELMAEMPLQELRRALKLTQEQLATVLETNQASVSKLERRTDMFVSTLRSYVAAMGGELEIVARFPEGFVLINQFEDLEEEPEDRETAIA